MAQAAAGAAVAAIIQGLQKGKQKQDSFVTDMSQAGGTPDQQPTSPQLFQAFTGQDGNPDALNGASAAAADPLALFAKYFQQQQQ